MGYHEYKRQAKILLYFPCPGQLGPYVEADSPGYRAVAEEERGYQCRLSRTEVTLLHLLAVETRDQPFRETTIKALTVLDCAWLTPLILILCVMG